MEEWDALPWWQQKMYYEGYVWEGILTDGVDSESTTTTVGVTGLAETPLPI